MLAQAGCVKRTDKISLYLILEEENLLGIQEGYTL
jgi:hypothetical protein